jgi:hypothetical protein
MVARLFAAALAALLLGGSAIAAAPARIDFTVAPTESAAASDKVQLGLSYRAAGGGKSHTSRPVPLGELQGLTAAQLASDGAPVRFSLVRDAGRLDCDGIVRQRRGTGDCRFAPDARYAAELARRGIARPTEKQQFDLTMHGADLAVVDELLRQGYAKPKVDDIVEAGIFGVTVPYLRELDMLGYRVGTVDRLVEMRIHRVTPDYIREMAAAGPAYRRLPPEQLVEMRIHGVTPERVRGYAQAGYANLTRRQIMDMAIHRVTPDYIGELAAAGYRNIAPEKLVEMRIHGVTADMARRANAAVKPRN